MEVKEEGKRKLTGRCRLGRQLHEGVVAGAGSSRSGRGQRRQRAAPRAGNHQAFLLPSHAPPAGERHGRTTLVVHVGGTPHGPAELHGSAGHHQVPASTASVRRASSSVALRERIRGGGGSIGVHGVLVPCRRVELLLEEVGGGVDPGGRAGACTEGGGVDLVYGAAEGAGVAGGDLVRGGQVAAEGAGVADGAGG
jgi:hypothetical protein